MQIEMAAIEFFLKNTFSSFIVVANDDEGETCANEVKNETEECSGASSHQTDEEDTLNPTDCLEVAFGGLYEYFD